MTKQATIDLLKQQLPGFYSAEQVIDMISKIEPEVLDVYEFEMNYFNDERIKTLVDNVVDEITDQGIDLVSDYDLSMNYKEVELDSIDLNNHSVKGAVKSAVQNWIEWFKEEKNS